MDETPPTNELIERLTGRLSPEGREVQEELEVLTGTLDANMAEAEVEARIDEAIAHMGHLPEEDQNLLSQIAQLKSRTHESRGEELADEAQEAIRDAAELIEMAQALQHADGETPDESMTVSEALAILERHGGDVPEVDTERAVEVPQAGKRIVPAFYPDFTNADNWKRWDGSERAEAWARLVASREAAILASVGELAGAGVEGTDYTGLIAALWNLDEDEAAEFVRLRQGGQP